MPISPRNAIKKDKHGVKFNVFVLKNISRKKIPLSELAVFCRKAAFLLDSGVHIKDAMPVLAQQTKGTLGSVTADLHGMVMQGESFSHALKTTGTFPAFMCVYIAIGERAAQLPQVCARLADYYESRAQTENEFAAAMLYPAAVAVMMLAVIAMAITFVLPDYSRIFASSGIELPGFTSVLLNASEFFNQNFFAVFFAAFFIATATFFFFTCEKGQAMLAQAKLAVPVWRQSVNFSLTQALSLLLASGQSIAEALPMCGEMTGNPVVNRDFARLSTKVSSGVEFWRALTEIPYIDPLLIELVRVGEDAGNLSQVIEKCNAYFETEYRHAIRRLNKLIEPIITLVLGAILAAIMLAVILPTFQLATEF